MNTSVVIAPDSFSLSLVLFLQSLSTPWLDTLMLSVTALGDPTLIFLLIAPTVYLLAKD